MRLVVIGEKTRGMCDYVKAAAAEKDEVESDEENRAVLTLVLTAVLTGLLLYTAAVGWGEEKSGAAKNIRLGTGSGRRREHHI